MGDKQLELLEMAQTCAHDIIPCDCCGKELPNLLALEAMEFDRQEWDRRIAALRPIFEGYYQDRFTEDRYQREAAFIVATNMFKSWLAATQAKSAQTLIVERERASNAKQVYFMQEAGGGPIKIGFAADPEDRRKSLEGHKSLVLLATEDGGRQKETDLHQRFAKFRVKGEWFDPVPELLDYIDAVKLGATS